MSAWRITREQVWYGLAFILALGLRFGGLGVLPLSDSEAALALQSLGIAQGAHPLLSGQPGSLLVTAALFFGFGSTNFLARFWPALAGSLLIFAPLGFRRFLGGRAALILAFFLALDPGLVALSRQTGSPIPAVAFTLLAAALWLARKPVWAGIAAGLAILGGPQFWNGLVGIGITLGILTVLSQRQPVPAGPDETIDVEPEAQTAFSWRSAGIAAAITIAAVGTLFWLAPEGLSALGGSISAFFQQWTTPSGNPAVLLLAALGGDELLFIGLAIWGLYRGMARRSLLEAGLGIWLIAALLLAILPPGRQVGGLAWALIPLLALAARGAAAIGFGVEEERDRVPAWVYTGIVLFLVGFIFLNLTGLLIAWRAGDSTLVTRGIALGGGIILLVAATLLVGWGWSEGVAKQGFLRGGLLALVIFQVSAVTAAAGWRLTQPAVLWGSYPRPEHAGLLGETLADFSGWHTGDRTSIDVLVAGEPSPSMAWYLRDFSAAQSASQLTKTQSPSIVITPQQDQPPQLGAEYRGQPLPWDSVPDWAAMSGLDWVNWMVFRQAPMRESTVIFWARSDIFLGANLSPANGGQ